MFRLRRILKFIPGFRRPRIIKKAILFLIVIGIIAGFSAGIFILEYKDFNDIINDKVVSRFPSLAFLGRTYKLLDIFYFYSYFQETKLSRYELIINPGDLAKLNENLPDIGVGALDDEHKKFVPAILKYDNQEYEVEVRYRGDSSVHWAYPKKSWRVRLTKKIIENKGLVNGMGSFNLIIGGDRVLISEQLSYYRAKKLGLAVPHSEFVELNINGEYQGAYWFLEHWDKAIFEKNNKAGDVNLYGEYDFDFFHSVNIFSYTDKWRKYTQDKISSFDNFSEIDQLLYLLKETTDEEFYEKIPELVNLENFYKWNIISLLIGGDGQAYDNNCRIYFDNTQGKFNFIPWDVAQGERPELYDAYVSPIADRILSNPYFLQERNNYLWDYIANEDNLEDDLNYYDKLYNEVKVSFHQDNLKLYSSLFFDKQVSNRRKLVIQQFENIKDKLSEAEASVEIRIDTASGSNQRVVTDLKFLTRNFNSLDVKKISFKWNQPGDFKLYDDTNDNGVWDVADQKIGDFKRDDKWYEVVLDKEIFALRDYEDYEKFREDKFYQENFFRPIDILITPYHLFIVSRVSKFVPENFKFRVENSSTGKKADLTKRFIDLATFANFSDIFKSRLQFVSDNPIFKQSTDGLILLGGVYQINKNIIIPKGTSLTIQAGTQLYFASSTSLISYSPVNIMGTKNNPIIFTAQNKNRPWGVLGLTESSGENVIKNTIFEYGSEDYINGIYFSGMVSSYWAGVNIDGCTFRYARADDGLNIKNSDTSIVANSLFYKNSADGIDVDFSAARVENNTFIDNGNDSIDLSSNQPFVYNNDIRGSGDKGISVGEDSQAIIINNLIRDSKIGIEVKDFSTPKIINNTIIDNEIGINSYKKKAIFGGGKGEVYNSIIWGNDIQIGLDKFSEITIEYSNIQGDYKGKGNKDIEPKFDTDHKVKDNELKGKREFLEEYIEQTPTVILMGRY